MVIPLRLQVVLAGGRLYAYRYADRLVPRDGGRWPTDPLPSVRLQAPEPDADLAVQRRVVDAFLAAARAGDLEALVAVLDPEAVLRTDVGGTKQPPRPPVVGARQVAAEVAARGRGFARLARPAIVNGAAGLVVPGPRGPVGVIAFTVSGGRIVAIDLVASPAKLRPIQHDQAQP